MRCPVCEGTEWKNVDQFRIKPSGMAQCQGCGFVSYPKKYQSEDQIKAHYRNEYRAAPTVMNLFSGERKLYYHEAILGPLLKEWKEGGLIEPVVGEIGAAMGMFLNWLKIKVPGAQVYGTELTTTYRRVAKHEFGLDLTEEFDFKRSYDLIVSYHVLEHQMDPDLMLYRYAEALKPSGVMYLSCPVWFREATNFGQSGFDLEYYWAPDHINCWSEEHLEYVIKKAGLEILFKNTDIYGNSYILKRAVAEPSFDPKWDVNKYAQIVERLHKCWKLTQENETALAIETYPNCPNAWIHHYELHRSKFHENSAELEKFIQSGIAACPNTSDMLNFAGDVMTRYEKWDLAFDYFTRALRRKPNSPTILMAMSNCLRQKALREKDQVLKETLLNQALGILAHVRATSLELSATAISWMYHDQSLITIPGEVK